MFKHQKFWRKELDNGNFQHFTSVEEAKEIMGFIDGNPAFDYSLCNNVEWQLHDNIYLSYTVTFETNEKQQQWLDNKHAHDTYRCYLTNGVSFDSSKCRFDW